MILSSFKRYVRRHKSGHKLNANKSLVLFTPKSMLFSLIYSLPEEEFLANSDNNFGAKLESESLDGNGPLDQPTHFMFFTRYATFM